MRESDNPDVVGVLDTLDECKIIEDALSEPATIQDNLEKSELTTEEWLQTLGVRFRLQTQYDIGGVTADGSPFMDVRFKPSPEFAVLPQDVDFVFNAARKVIERNYIREKLLKITPKRKKAARGIINFLTN